MNWDYIAGFFDGEGCVYTNKKSQYGRYTYSLGFAQDDISPLIAISDFLPSNSIHSTMTKRDGHHMLWIHRQPDVLRVLTELKDRCIVKCLRAEEVVFVLSSRNLRQDNSSYCYFTVHKEEGEKVKALWLSGKGIIRISSETGYSISSLYHFIYRILGGAKLREVHREAEMRSLQI